MLKFKDLELGKTYINHGSICGDDSVTLDECITIHHIDTEGSVFTQNSSIAGMLMNDGEGWCIWSVGEDDFGQFELVGNI